MGSLRRHRRDSWGSKAGEVPVSRQENPHTTLIAWYRDGDAEETVRLYERGRTAGGYAATAPVAGLTPGVEEIHALLESGRVDRALELTESMEGLRNPFWKHAAWYMSGRAYETLGEHGQALQSYQMLLDTTGEGIREIVLFRNTPERVARLRGNA